MLKEARLNSVINFVQKWLWSTSALFFKKDKAWILMIFFSD